jgi:hypothetical protein
LFIDNILPPGLKAGASTKNSYSISKTAIENWAPALNRQVRGVSARSLYDFNGPD